MEKVILAGRQAEDVVDLVRAEVVIGVLAVDVMIVDIVATHKKIASLHAPIQS